MRTRRRSWKDAPVTMGELDDAKYIALTTFKRDGSGVTTPVWLVPTDDGCIVTTGVPTGKYKRLRNNNAVEVAVSNARGSVRPDAKVYKGVARLLDAEGTASAEQAIRDRYGIMAKIMNVLYSLGAKLQRKEFGPMVGLEITLDEGD